MHIDTLTYSNLQTQGVQRRAWLGQHSAQHLESSARLILHGLQQRQPGTSPAVLVLGAGACTEVPLLELARAADEVVLADFDLAAIQLAQDELSSPTLRKRVSLQQCDISGGVSASLNWLIEQQPWKELVPQGARAIFDAAAQCLERCPVPDPPEIQSLGVHEFGLVISSLVLTQLFSYPLLDILDHIQRIAPDYLTEQERHRRYSQATQEFRVRIIQAHLHLLRELVDIGGIIVLLSDVRGFVFDIHSGNDKQHRRTLPLVPRTLPDLVRENFAVLEEAHWEWISDLPGKDKLGRGYEVVGYVLRA